MNVLMAGDRVPDPSQTIGEPRSRQPQLALSLQFRMLRDPPPTLEVLQRN